MSKLDEIKEELGWLKVWLAISMTAIFGILGWFVANYEKVATLWLILAMITIVVLVIIVVAINSIAMKKIRELRDLT